VNALSIIVNADDFGRHELINQAVELGFRQGLIRSATLMVTGGAFAQAVGLAKANPGLGVGIHLTLVDGKPVLNPSQIPSIIDPDTGRFYADHGAFVKHFLKGKVRISDVRHEWEAQMQRFLETGLFPTHADSHQHMHVLPGIIDVTMDLCARYNVPAVRIPSIPVALGQTHFSNMKQQIGRTGLHVLAEVARRKAHAFHLVTSDAFEGIVAGEAVDTSRMRRILLGCHKGCTEIMLHPGMNDAILQADSHWDHGYEKELAAVTDPGICDLCRSLGIRIWNYRDLASSVVR
jgi:hopanoid biosynthesis associated protein HpnK